MKKILISILVIFLCFGISSITACNSCGCQKDAKKECTGENLDNSKEGNTKTACSKSKKECCKSKKSSSCNKKSSDGFNFNKSNNYGKKKKCCKKKSSCSKNDKSEVNKEEEKEEEEEEEKEEEKEE
tara:strand:- start:147 stop:527 length:381 start_codon:yes stop_codon:yes gene_type:complete